MSVLERFRNRWTITAAVAAVVLGGLGAVSAPAAALEAAEPVPNGGFEDPVVDGAIPGWRQTFGATPSFTVVDAPVHGGAAAVRVEDTSGTDSAGLQSDRSAVTGGQSYDVSAWVNRETGFTSLFVYFYDADGNRTGSDVVETVQTPANTWTQHTITTRAPSDATQASVMLYSGGVVVTTATFDDVTIADAENPIPGELTHVGTPIANVAIDKVAYGTSADGDPIVYMVLLGSPTTHLVMVDLRSGETLHRVALPNAIGSRDLEVAPDGSVYMATFQSGRLYHYDPATDELTDLGRPAPDATYLYGLSIDDEDGTVYFGAYPTGRVYSYDPDTGTIRDYGQVSPDSQYVRSVRVWEDTLIAGLGTQRARVFSIDIDSGAKTEIALPAPYADEHEVNQITIRDDIAYVHLTTSRTMLRYDLAAGRWLTSLGTAAGLDVSSVSPDPRQEVYYVGGDGKLHAHSTRTNRDRTVDAFDAMFSSRGFSWVDLQRPQQRGETLVMIDYIGRLWIYHPRTRTAEVSTLDIPGEPVYIRALGSGPDGKVWAGGLGSGGLSSYDPETGAIQQVPRGTIGQSDEMLVVGNDLYLGTYPGGTLLKYDPAQEYVWGTNPGPVANFAADGQDRPLALVEADGKVVVGLVPNYGQRSGAIGVYDPATGTTSTQRGVSGERSVVTLATDDDVVYAGTSAWGGLGIEPADVDGTVFAFDPATGEKLWETTPVSGQPAVPEVALSPSGTLWGLSRGVLFELDPATQQVIRTIDVPVENWDTVDHIWGEGRRLAVASDGTVYALVNSTVLRVDPATGITTEVTGGVSNIELVSDTVMYLTKAADLYRLDLDTP